ncbi:response regulator transcription factor [Marinococcus sp. PL1-022]|uniref:response regulator transcription factor n=1 Tax=Marinococcus sp. PL1-022 TaxID=3095363 RepID=UPI0029C51C36|nr:helix-turn-helix domain-containing protein [Marinococcus sp. PL1-022]MDX6154139.1 response regulator [Marinococcus sp. PL1-022]
MIRLLMAEDEWLERKAMKKLIAAHLPEIEVIGEAENGPEAVELAIEKSPDIMLMDIKMPGCNGLEAIQRIQQAASGIHFIMVTAYDSFDYAREALGLGVKEYLLKPGKKEETIQTLMRVQTAVNRSRQERKQYSHRLQKLLFQSVCHGEPYENHADLLIEAVPEASYGFAVVMREEDMPEDIEEKMNRWTNDAFLTDRQPDGWFRTFFFHTGKNRGSEEVERLRRRMHFELGEKASIGISEKEHDVKQLFQAYVEALSGLEKDQDALPEQSSQWVSSIVNALRTGEEKSAIYYWSEWWHTRPQKSSRRHLWLQLEELVKEMNGTLEEDMPSDAAEWKRLLHVVGAYRGLHFREHHQIEKVKAYVKEHYAKPLQLEDIAGYVQWSPAYFSHQFKEVTGVSFVDYVTRVRMQEAKRMLQDRERPLKEISISIGYKDPNYFSRVFKKQVGCSPKQYQQGKR